MLTAQRRDLLLERLRRDGRLVAREIAGELGVTEDMREFRVHIERVLTVLPRQ